MYRRIITPTRPPRVLALAHLTDAVGHWAYYVTAVLYFARIVGLSPTRNG